jgi:hypothetical protein
MAAAWHEFWRAALVPGTLANRAVAARKQGHAAYEKFRKDCTAKERTALDMMAKVATAEWNRALSTPRGELIADGNRYPWDHANLALEKLIKDTEKRLGRGAAWSVFARWKNLLELTMDHKSAMRQRLLKAMPKVNMSALAREIALENMDLPKEEQKGWGSTNEADIRVRLQELLQDIRNP